jgi:Tol biopolymer transport system component
MKKLIVTLAAAVMAIASTGCGSDSTPSPMVTYVARASTGNAAPQLFTLNESTKKSTAVSIPIPATAYYVASNSTATAVAYYRDDDTNYDIFTMGTNGTETQLTTGAEAWAPVFSPDGKRIAYVSGNTEEIFTMNVDGSSQTALYAAGSGVVYQYLPQFSPDSKSLVFWIEANECQDCSSTSGQKINHKAFSPPTRNGMKPAALHKSSQPQTGTPTQTGWYTMALTDSTPTLVYATNNWWGPAVYSSDGTKLLITDYDGSEWNILSVHLDGTGVTPLTTGIVAQSISPVPYKNLILYNVTNNSNSSWDIYVMSQTGTNQTLLSSTTDVYESLIDSFWSED